MPEVIEIKRFTNFLKHHMLNKPILDIKILKGRYKTHGPPDMFSELKKQLPLKVLDVQSKGKFIYFTLEKEFFIFNTLGLKGGWAYHDKKWHLVNQYYEDLNMDVALNNLSLKFELSHGDMYFYDQISYGTIKIIKGQTALVKKLRTLGPDIMDMNTTFLIFRDNIKKKKNLTKPIGNVIVDQKVISGMGNYLRSDVLWLSKISPFRKVNTLSDQEILTIYRNSRLLTWGDYDRKEGIKLKIFPKSKKLPSDYGRHFFVYKQETDIHGNPVEVDELYEGSQKRAIYWVPAVQK